MILAERAARLEAEAVAARAQAVNAGTEALITHYRLEIEKLRRQLYGTRSEKKARLLEQMEMQLEETLPRRTNWRRRRRRLNPRRRYPSSASGRPASRSQRTCRASAS